MIADERYVRQILILISLVEIYLSKSITLEEFDNRYTSEWGSLRELEAELYNQLSKDVLDKGLILSNLFVSLDAVTHIPPWQITEEEFRDEAEDALEELAN